MSTLVEHALRELPRVESDPWLIDGLVKVVQAFAEMGHSGGSASVAIPMLNDLLLRKNLSPLTDDPAEWQDMSKIIGGTPIWQNIRNSEALSLDGGKTYYLVSEIDGLEPENYIFHTTEPMKEKVDG